MRRFIREHLWEAVAIVGLLVVATASSYAILQSQRLRIPVLEEKPFELKAEFTTAQAVVPGQGQTIRVAGVRIGDVEDVDLEGGHAVVTFGIDREYLPIYRNAQVLMRPATALKDMFFELDPGSQAAGEYEEGATIPAANTLPDINLDEVLAALDTDSRNYLRLLAGGLGGGLRDRGADLGRSLRALGPVNRDFARLNTTLEKRDDQIARLIHNLNLLSGAVGRRDDELAQLIDASNAAVGAFAGESDDVQRFTAELPGTLRVTRRTLIDATPFARELGPTFRDLRPFARRLDGIAAATRKLSEGAAPVLAHRIRPFVRAARPVAGDLRVASRRFARSAPNLLVIGRKINRLGNMTAYNPGGAEAAGTEGRDEGYLYWLGWFSHIGDGIFTGQDAHGTYRRLFLTGACENLQGLLETGPGGPAVAGIIYGLGPLFAAGGECNP